MSPFGLSPSLWKLTKSWEATTPGRVVANSGRDYYDYGSTKIDDGNHGQLSWYQMSKTQKQMDSKFEDIVAYRK